MIGENKVMDLSALHTISDIESLRSLALQIIGSRDAEILEHRRENHHKQTRIEALTAEIARLRRVQFAARSEKMNPEQRALFDEAIEADIAAVEVELEALRTSTPPRRARSPSARSCRRIYPEWRSATSPLHAPARRAERR